MRKGGILVGIEELSDIIFEDVIVGLKDYDGI